MGLGQSTPHSPSKSGTSPHSPTAMSLMPYSMKRNVVVRLRVALLREQISRLQREADALENRLSRMILPKAEELAERSRIEQLRRRAEFIRATVVKLNNRARITSDAGLFGSLVLASERLVAGQLRSFSVFFTELNRQADPWGTICDATKSVLRLASNVTLVQGYIGLGLRESPLLFFHAVAIYAKAARLERYAPGILDALEQPVSKKYGVIVGSDGKARPLSYLQLIEPHLDEILERFDDIAPHVPFCLGHLDVLVPHLGILLKHLDALLLYADEGRTDDSQELSYSQTRQLMQYLPYFAPRLDALGPHLELIRPHIPRLMPVLPLIAPYADRFAPHVSISANADVLLWYFEWVLRIPFLRRILLVPGFPRLAAWMSRRLPRFPVRGRRSDVGCNWEDCETSYVANAQRYFEQIGAEEDVEISVREALGSRRASREWRRWRRANRQ